MYLLAYLAWSSLALISPFVALGLMVLLTLLRHFVKVSPKTPAILASLFSALLLALRGDLLGFAPLLLFFSLLSKRCLAISIKLRDNMIICSLSIAVLWFLMVGIGGFIFLSEITFFSILKFVLYVFIQCLLFFAFLVRSVETEKKVVEDEGVVITD